MAKRQWWEKPRLRTDEEEERERRVGWLELFYDLVFVVVVAELSHSLSEHVSLEGVTGFIGYILIL
jgi:low temperature requirement protein LtrA